MRDNAFASLTSGLLARKGQAKPAMRPQGGYGIGIGGHDDLGWNDMGAEAPKPPIARAAVEAVPSAPPAEPTPDAAVVTPPPADAAPQTPVVVRQQAQLAAALAVAPTPPAQDATAPSPEPARAAPPEVTARRHPREAGRKAAFTLRLDAERHLRLRLACAVENRSAQQIVTAALDRFLATLPDVERLATSLGAPSAARD